MITHVVLGTDDIPAAKKFYDAVLGALGHAAALELEDGRLVYQGDPTFIVITKPINGRPATAANGGTVGLAAPSRESVDAFHAAGLAAGGFDEGAPGPRAVLPGSYAAILRDPTGNKLIAWCMNES